MLKILITGENSYIGQSLKTWISRKNNGYQIETISLRNKDWYKVDFSVFDTIIHTVGIAHVDSKPDKSMENKYYEINRDLAIKTAEKAKNEGVSQFIFLSSIIVYGNRFSYISSATNPNPENYYGNSKLEAEKGLLSLENDNFKIAIVRLPMIYGKDSKGNYPLLAKLAKLTPIFPKIENSRSMLYIDNLCEFLYLLIKNHERGTFFPQNEEYVNTSNLVLMISKEHNKFIMLTSFFNLFIKSLRSHSVTVEKVFGDLVYEKDLSRYKENYNVLSFEETIKYTER